MRALATGLRVPVSLSRLPSSVSVTGSSTSVRRSCFPFEVRLDTGPLLLGRVRCLPFPDVIAPIGPSDSSPSSAAAPVVPRKRPTSGRALLLCRPQVHPLPAARRRFLSRLPVPPVLPEEGRGLPGRWVVLLKRAAVRDPAEHLAAWPLVATTLLPSGTTSPWALGNHQFRGWTHAARVLARLRIIRRHRCPRSKARYRPAGLGFGWAGFAPAGRLLEIS